MKERREGVEGYSQSPKESVRPEDTVNPDKLRYDKQLRHQLREREQMTNVPGASAFDAAVEVEEKP